MNNKINTLMIQFFTVLPLVLLFLFLGYFYPNMSFSLPWVPSLGVDFSFDWGPLESLFTLLILGIGFGVQVYSYHYMKGKERQGLFHFYLTIFMIAMLGVVSASNVWLLFTFWEMTTISSYLLIGFNHEVLQSRKNALMGLLITGLGGLSILGGLIIMSQMLGSSNIPDWSSLSYLVHQNPSLFSLAFALILIGAFTKSAQFPFHFWLPGAMVAPTPVSAYLHSATMVKAGVFLLAKLSFILSIHSAWTPVLTAIGAATVAIAIWNAVGQKDIKLMMAYTTNVVLGLLVFLLGVGTPYALTALVLLLVAHAFYKAGLFMIIGSVDKLSGTRDFPVLGGLKKFLPKTHIAIWLLALSSAGVPPLLGFLAKEYLYKTTLYQGWGWTLLFVVANSLMATLAWVILMKVFLGDVPSQFKPKYENIEKKWGLWLPPMILAVLSILVPTVLLTFFNQSFLIPIANQVSPSLSVGSAKLWSGVNMALVLSVGTFILSLVFYKFFSPLQRLWSKIDSKLPQGPSVFEKILAYNQKWMLWVNTPFDHKKPSWYINSYFVTIAGFVIYFTPWNDVPQISIKPNLFIEWVLAVVILFSLVWIVKTHSRLFAIVSLSVIGFAITLVFTLYSAPDVAKTQLLVEALIVVFMVFIMRHLPRLRSVPDHSKGRRVVHMIIALTIGFGITWQLLLMNQSDLSMALTAFYSNNALTLAHGRNIVNVILVDFRAFDTLGEVFVVVIAAFASIGLLNKVAKKGKGE
ncbi:proton-conducting transporter membrane subunit [Fibrobacterales bacterium]|nr:proton-conducting transporter membrane subunit [Fibrobacterales bacterium]